jgi:hypothetical protein
MNYGFQLTMSDNFLVSASGSLDSMEALYNLATGTHYIHKDEPIDLHVPYTGPYKFIVNSNADAYASVEDSNHSSRTLLAMMNDTGARARYHLFVAAGEDFTYGHLISPGIFSLK